MDFFETVQRRRSVRRFKPDPVPDSVIKAMLEAARLAPSAENTQPWRFIAIRDRDLLAQLQSMVNALAESKLAAARTDGERKVVRQLLPYSQQFTAPVVIAALGEMRDALVYFEPALQSVSAAITHILLAATALGYGACWATGPVALAGEELEALLGVERPWRLLAVLSVGLSDEKPWRILKRPVKDIATFV